MYIAADQNGLELSMPRKLRLADQLIIPFGRPKWKIEKINIVKVSPSGTYIEGDLPFAYIDKKENRPLQVADFWEIVPDNFLSQFKSISPHFDRNEDDISQRAVTEFTFREDLILSYLKERCELGSLHEKRFLDIYFNHSAKRAVESMDLLSQCVWSLMRPLLPLPQAHLYLEDGLEEKTYMQKVDFAFWTGTRLIAIEIDSESKPLPDVVRRDRRYRESGVEVVHIFNSEIDELGSEVMRLLPEELKSESFFNQLPSRSPYIDHFDIDIWDEEE